MGKSRGGRQDKGDHHFRPVKRVLNRLEIARLKARSTLSPVLPEHKSGVAVDFSLRPTTIG